MKKKVMLRKEVLTQVIAMVIKGSIRRERRRKRNTRKKRKSTREVKIIVRKGKTSLPKK